MLRPPISNRSCRSPAPRLNSNWTRLAVEPLEDRRLLAVTPEFLDGQIVGTLESSSLDEASGLVASRDNSGVLWSHNDSGDAARLFALGAAGEHLGEYLFAGIDQVDWEDIAIGPGPTPGVDYLYVADTGDNLRRRDSIGIVRVVEPAVDAQQEPVDVDLAAFETFELVYPDGPRNAETLLVDPISGDVVIVSKSDVRNHVYRVTQAQLQAQLVTGEVITLELVGMTTWGDTSGGGGLSGAIGGDVSAAGDEIIIKSYDTIFYYERLPGMNIAEALVDVSPETLPYTREPKGEGITFDPATGGYFTTGELVSGQNSVPLYFYERVIDEVPPTASLIAPQDNGPLDGDPLATAALIAAFSGWRGAGGLNSAESQSITQSRSRAMAGLAALQADDGLFVYGADRTTEDRALVSAFVLYLLADDQGFRQSVRFADLSRWFEQRHESLDADTLELWQLSRTAGTMAGAGSLVESAAESAGISGAPPAGASAGATAGRSVRLSAA